MNRRTFLALLGIGQAGATRLLTGCRSAGQEPAGRLRIATGSTNAVYYTYGSAIARLVKRTLPKVQATVLVTAASQENVYLVLRGGAELAFTQADIAGAGNVDSPGQLASLARIYDDCVHLVVRDGTAIRSLADLSGRRVSVGAPGSGTGVTAARLLAVAGKSVADGVHTVQLGLDDSVAALRGGTIDAFFFSGGLPVLAIAKLAYVVSIQLVDLQQYVQPLRKSFGGYYADRVVPASTYAGIATTVTVGIPNYLVVRSMMPESLAYELTRLLFDGRSELAKAHPVGARLNPRSAINTPPLALHTGATRYYREAKE